MACKLRLLRSRLLSTENRQSRRNFAPRRKSVTNASGFAARQAKGLRRDFGSVSLTPNCTIPRLIRHRTSEMKSGRRRLRCAR